MPDQLDDMKEVLVSDIAFAPPRRSVWDAWFCLRTDHKREHMAAAQLRRDPAIEVYLPRIRYERLRRSSRTWITEALFPNYLFARFDLITCGRRVRHAWTVREMVHFGSRYPTIPEAVIEELRATIGTRGSGGRRNLI